MRKFSKVHLKSLSTNYMLLTLNQKSLNVESVVPLRVRFEVVRSRQSLYRKKVFLKFYHSCLNFFVNSIVFRIYVDVCRFLLCFLKIIIWTFTDSNFELLWLILYVSRYLLSVDNSQVIFLTYVKLKGKNRFFFFHWKYYLVCHLT